MKKDSLKTMRDHLDNLSREWESISKIFKSDDNVLYDFGKIAVCVEQAICSFVFPDTFEDGADANLHNLLNILNDSDSPFISRDPDKNGCEENLHAAKCEENLHAAKRRWGNICKTFDFPDEWISKSGEWDVYDYNVPGDIRAIKVLKLSLAQIRVTKNPVSLKNAEQNIECIRDELPPWQFELVAAFIGSLKEKMTKSELSHDYLCLD